MKLLLEPLLLNVNESSFNSSGLPQCGPLIELYILVTGKKPIWICYSVSKWMCYWYNIDQKKEKEMIWSEDIQFPMFYASTVM
jgi:hypothetical protein